MKLIIFIYSFIHFSSLLLCQQSWTGNFEGDMHGENVKLILYHAANGYISGTMTDASNTYDISGKVSNYTFQGKAIEKRLGLTFDMSATPIGDLLQVILSIDVFGEVQKIEINLKKTGKPANQENKPQKIPTSEKNRDINVVGLWVKESKYNSGYGDNYGAMSISENMEFLSDGRMAEGDSQAVISGQAYFGSSTAAQKKIIDGVFWYTEHNRIFLNVVQNNQTQTVELGKYYIENNKMLITGSNGQKLLLTKKR